MSWPLAPVIGRIAEVERRMRDLEYLIETQLAGDLSDLALALDGAKDNDKNKGLVTPGNLVDSLFPGGGGGLWGQDPLDLWPPIWNPGPGWTGPDLPPGGGVDDNNPDGPWGPAGPGDGQAVQLSKYMHDSDHGAYIAFMPVTCVESGQSGGVTDETADAPVHGRVVFRVRNKHSYTLSWGPWNGYPAGSEAVNVVANQGGVMKVVNEISKAGSTWPPIFNPPVDPPWPGVDPAPGGGISDNPGDGPWGPGVTPQPGQSVQLSKHMTDFSNGAAIVGIPVTCQGSGGSATVQTDANGRAAFRVRQGQTFTLTWPAENGYRSGSESVSMSAGSSGVQVVTNRVTKDTGWQPIWSPPTTWPGLDLFPTDPTQGTWDDGDTSGPWGTNPPPAGQAVRVSKRFVDKDTGAPITGFNATMGVGGQNSAGTSSASGSAVPGRIAWRTQQGAEATISWGAQQGYAAGSESLTVQANGGGVHKMTNQLQKTSTGGYDVTVTVNYLGSPFSGCPVDAESADYQTTYQTGTTDSNGHVTLHIPNNNPAYCTAHPSGFTPKGGSVSPPPGNTLVLGFP